MKYISQWVFIIVIILFVFSAISILTSHQGFALRLIIFAFWFLAAGVFVYLWSLKNEK